jgi:phosphoribosyl-ATP pyrophosphohydrolase
MSTHDILHRLSETLASRRNADPEKSYTAKLFANGPDSILKKIGEECAELIMAGKEGKRLKVVWESTDVIYHVLVLLAFYGLSIEDVRRKCVVVKAFPASMKRLHGAASERLHFLQDRRGGFLR